MLFTYVFDVSYLDCFILLDRIFNQKYNKENLIITAQNPYIKLLIQDGTKFKIRAYRNTLTILLYYQSYRNNVSELDTN